MDFGLVEASALPDRERVAAVAEAAKPPRRPPALLLSEPLVDPGRGHLPSQGADPVEHVGEPSGLQAREFPVAGVVEEEGGRQLTGSLPRSRSSAPGEARLRPGRPVLPGLEAEPDQLLLDEQVMVGSSMSGIGRALVDEAENLAGRVGRLGAVVGIRSMYRPPHRAAERRRVLSADHGRLTFFCTACTEVEERDMLMLRNNYHRRGQAPGAPGAPGTP